MFGPFVLLCLCSAGWWCVLKNHLKGTINCPLRDPQGSPSSVMMVGPTVVIICEAGAAASSTEVIRGDLTVDLGPDSDPEQQDDKNTGAAAASGEPAAPHWVEQVASSVASERPQDVVTDVAVMAAREHHDGETALAGASPAAPQGDEPPDDDDQQSMRWFRREGVPCKVWIHRTGDLFQTLTPDVKSSDDALMELTSMRMQVLSEKGLSGASFLDTDDRREVVRRYFRSWLGRESRSVLDELWRRCETADAYHRTLQSNFRVHTFQFFGGLPWMHWYAALGDVPDELIAVVNEYISAVVRKDADRAPAVTPQRGPRLSERNRAIRTGEDAERIPPHRGVQHKASEGKALRKAARHLGKQMETEKEKWRQGRSQMSWSQWQSLVRRYQDSIF